MKFTEADREKLLQLAKLFNVNTGARSVRIPSEVLSGVSKTLTDIATDHRRTFTREAIRQMSRDPSSRHMATYCRNHRLAG